MIKVFETYDETGFNPNDHSFESSADWDQYWRLLFPKMTVKQMDTFRDKYFGSEDEKKDIKRIWNIFTSHLMAIWISSQSDIAFDDRTPQLLLQIIRDKECIIWRFCQKESNKCKVTAEEDLLLSIESIWNRNESVLDKWQLECSLSQEFLDSKLLFREYNQDYNRD